MITKLSPARHFLKDEVALLERELGAYAAALPGATAVHERLRVFGCWWVMVMLLDLARIQAAQQKVLFDISDNYY